MEVRTIDKKEKPDIVSDLQAKARPTSKKAEKRARIRNAFSGNVAVEEIPSEQELLPADQKPKLRVCAYCRVSTEMDTQVTSYELQVQNYTEYITQNPDWEFAGIYADEGISGTSMLHRDDFNRMLEDAKQHKFDLIITKQINRFSRNILDSISTTRMLKALNPPVGVLFENEHLNTLDASSETLLGLLSLVAQAESEQKSNSLKWSYIKRWKHGIVNPTWSLRGYYLDEEGQWAINEEEALVVRFIYNAYLNGHSSPEIADLLTNAGIPTATGLEKWSVGAVLGILHNEKYVGDVMCQKTASVDLFNHTVVVNRGQYRKYYMRDHHEPIIPRDEWDQVQNMLASKFYIKQHKRWSKPRVVLKGCLAGFTMIDPNWSDEEISAIFLAEKQHAPEPASSETPNVEIINIKGEQ